MQLAYPQHELKSHQLLEEQIEMAISAPQSVARPSSSVGESIAGGDGGDVRSGNVGGCGGDGSSSIDKPEQVPKTVKRLRQPSFFEDSDEEYTDDEDEEGGGKNWREQLQHKLAMVRLAASQNLVRIQAALLVVSLALATMVFLPLSLVYAGFKSQCLLNADLVLDWNNNNTVSVDLTLSVYGSNYDCNLTTYTTVVTALACFIFLWFYLCNILFTHTENKTSVNVIQGPALLILFSLFISVIVTASKITNGFKVWCDNLVTNIPPSGESLQCWQFEKLEWSGVNAFQFYTRYYMAEICSWLLCICLLILTYLTADRCYEILKNSANETKEKKGGCSTSQATLDSALPESQEAEVVVVDGSERGKSRLMTEAPELNGSVGHAEKSNPSEKELLQTEVTVHAAAGANDNTPPPAYSGPALFAPGTDMASGINVASVGDQSPLLLASKDREPFGYQNVSPESPQAETQNSSAGDDERTSLTKSGSSTGGYGAVSGER